MREISTESISGRRGLGTFPTYLRTYLHEPFSSASGSNTTYAQVDSFRLTAKGGQGRAQF